MRRPKSFTNLEPDCSQLVCACTEDHRPGAIGGDGGGGAGPVPAQPDQCLESEWFRPAAEVFNLKTEERC